MKHEKVIERMVQDIAEAHGDDPYVPDWVVATVAAGFAIYALLMIAFGLYLRAFSEA